MEEKEVCYHVPVMLHESLEGLDIQPSGVYVDVTFGGGGHSREILNRLDNEGELYGFDQDADAENNIPADPRFVFVRSNFRYLYNFMRYHGVAGEVDGLLADLGVSSHHFDDKDRGFRRSVGYEDEYPCGADCCGYCQYIYRRTIGRPVLSLRRVESGA